MQSLPDELVVEVLRHSDCRSLLRCSQTSRRLHAIINSSQILQYIVELDLTGTEDGSPACPLTTSERLELLRTRKQRRRLFEPVKAFSLSLNCPSENYVYDFVDGIFAFHYVENTTGTGADVSHLLTYDLSSKRHSEKLLSHALLDFVVVDFSIDPSRDLIAGGNLASDFDMSPTGPQICIHLRSLSSGGSRPHLEAGNARLEVADDTLTDAGDINVTLADDKVAYFSQSTLYIWRWTTGALLIHWKLSSHADWLNSFTFISSTSFVITRSGTECGHLCLYTLPPDDETSASTSPEDRQHTRFYLPELKQSYTAILSAHTGPLSRPKSPLAPAGSIVLLFVTTLDANGGVLGELSYAIRSSVFEEASPSAHPHGIMLRSPNLVHEVRWIDWGPENARILPYITDSMFAARGAHGSRFTLSVHRDDDPNKGWTHAYFDFADVRDRAFLDARHDGSLPLGPLGRAMKMRSCFRRELSGADGVFMQPVKSSSPYYSIETVWEKREDELLLDDERMVKMVHLADTGVLQLDVYDF